MATWWMVSFCTWLNTRPCTRPSAPAHLRRPGGMARQPPALPQIHGALNGQGSSAPHPDGLQGLSWCLVCRAWVFTQTCAVRCAWLPARWPEALVLWPRCTGLPHTQAQSAAGINALFAERTYLMNLPRACHRLAGTPAVERLVRRICARREKMPQALQVRSLDPDGQLALKKPVQALPLRVWQTAAAHDKAWPLLQVPPCLSP